MTDDQIRFAAHGLAMDSLRRVVYMDVIAEFPEVTDDDLDTILSLVHEGEVLV